MKNFLFLLVVLIILIKLYYKLEFYESYPSYSDLETDTSNTSQNRNEYDMDDENIDSSENNVILCSNTDDNTPDCEMSQEQYDDLELEMKVDPYDPNNLSDPKNESSDAEYNTSMQDEADLLNQLSEFTYNEESGVYEPFDSVTVHPDVSDSSVNKDYVNAKYNKYMADNENLEENLKNITDHEQSKYSSLNDSNILDGMTINDIYGNMRVFCTSTQDETWNESIGVDEDQSETDPNE